MTKLGVLILAGSVAIITGTQTTATAYTTTFLSQVPPIFMPTQSGVKVCWQTTHITNNDQVLQSACSSPTSPITPQPVPTTIPTAQPTPTSSPTPLPLNTPSEIKKEQAPTTNYQSQQSNLQTGNISPSSKDEITEVILPVLGVIKDILD